MIKVGDILLWGNDWGENRHRYIVVDMTNINLIRIEHVHTEEIYHEPLSNLIRCMEDGIIMIEKESIIPIKHIMKHKIK